MKLTFLCGVFLAGMVYGYCVAHRGPLTATESIAMEACGQPLVAFVVMSDGSVVAHTQPFQHLAEAVREIPAERRNLVSYCAR